jgi:hypothetical protein
MKTKPKSSSNKKGLLARNKSKPLVLGSFALVAIAISVFFGLRFNGRKADACCVTTSGNSAYVWDGAYAHLWPNKIAFAGPYVNGNSWVNFAATINCAGYYKTEEYADWGNYKNGWWARMRTYGQFSDYYLNQVHIVGNGAGNDQNALPWLYQETDHGKCNNESH